MLNLWRSHIDASKILIFARHTLNKNLYNRMDINSQKNSNNMPSPLAPENGNDGGKDTPSSQEATAVSVATSSADSIVPQLPSTIDCSPIENDNENNKRKREIDQSTKDSASDKANASSSAKAADGVPAKRTR